MLKSSWAQGKRLIQNFVLRKNNKNVIWCLFIVIFICIPGKSKILGPYDNRFTGTQDDWRSKKKLSGGGILLDQGIHLLDLIRFFNGDFQEYKSFISNKFWNYDVEDNAFALMRDKNGVIASIHSTATQWQHTFRIEITAKYALIELKGILSGTKSYGKESLQIIERLPKSSNGSKIKYRYFFNKDNSWKEEIDEFANIILKNLPIKTGNIYDALMVMKMIEKIYFSESGDTLLYEKPLEKWKMINEYDSDGNIIATGYYQDDKQKI